MSKSPFEKKDRVKVVNARNPKFNGLVGIVKYAGKSTGRVTIEMDGNTTQWFDFYPTSLEKLKVAQ